MSKAESQELFCIVDDLDEIIEYLPEELAHQQNKRERMVGVLLIREEDGAVVLQQRHRTKKIHPEFFTLTATGHVSKGETYEEAAQRELFEEMGVVTPLKFIDKIKTDFSTHPSFTGLFIGNYSGVLCPDKEETMGANYFTRPQVILMKSKMTPFAQEMLKRLGITL